MVAASLSPSASRRRARSGSALAPSLGGEAQRVSDVILARILEGAYPAGLRLPAEVELASELGCGRSTVREALRHLAGLGVVRSRRGSGAHVLDFRREGSPALLSPYLLSGAADLPPRALASELLRLRSWLAREAARLAATHANRVRLRAARAVLARAPSLEATPYEHALNELELFREYVHASGVWPAAWLANAFWRPLRELYEVLAPAIARVPARFQSTMEDVHVRVERGDAAGADEALARWFHEVDGLLLREVEGLLEAMGGERPKGAGK
jgi:GntR family transcriptional repressor for pyruvate dehydrogenase complex